MAALWDTLIFYFNFPFVRYALIAGALIALCSSLLGVTLVLKRFSFIGDSLSHVAFGAMAIASILSVNSDMLLVMPVTVACAVLLLRKNGAVNLRGDGALAMLSVGALALGYLVLNLFATFSNLTGDVCSTLFGSTSILTLTLAEVWLCAAMSLLVVGAVVFVYHKIFAIPLDETFAAATGVNAALYGTAVAAVTAVIIVLAMNLVGSLLTSALVVFPALSAMKLFKSYRGVVICSAVLSVSCALTGILIAILGSAPVGSTIVAVDIAAYLICWGAAKIMRTGRKTS